MKKIAIIGAGIGGLTTAVAFKQKGHKVTVYESAAEIKPVGAGIGLANNAMQIFKQLGIHKKIIAKGQKTSVMCITNQKLKALSVMDLEVFERKYGVFNVSIHRAALQHVLAEEIGFETIKLSKQLVKIEQNKSVTMHFSDGTIETADVVIAADGIKSVVRNQLFKKSEIRDTGQTCWRGVAVLSLPNAYQHQAVEAWGKGKRFGFVQINDEKVYWYAVANKSLVKSQSPNLIHLFSEFHDDVLKIVEQTAADSIIQNDIVDLKPIFKWYHKNVCLLGDAAHATTPNLGQGACQAIEDAYVLAQLYNPAIPIESIFEEYQKLRLKKVHQIVNSSWKVGTIAHLENPFAVYIRNTLMKCVPNTLNSMQLHRFFNLEYSFKAKTTN